MIFEEATYDSFGYYASSLSSRSSKYVIAVCDKCAKIRIVRRYAYYDLCLSCSHKGNINALGSIHFHTEKTKALMRESHLGIIFTEEHKANIAKAKEGDKNPMFGHFLDKHHNWKGGRKETFKRYRKTEKGKTNNAKVLAKRRQGLEYTLLMPLAEGEVGHHITNEYVIGIPERTHQILSGKRKKHRTRVLQWLKANDTEKYKLVLEVL